MYVYSVRTQSRGAKGSGQDATRNGDGEGAAGYLVTVPLSWDDQTKRTRCGARCVEDGRRGERFGVQVRRGCYFFFLRFRGRMSVAAARRAGACRPGHDMSCPYKTAFPRLGGERTRFSQSASANQAAGDGRDRTNALYAGHDLKHETMGDASREALPEDEAGRERVKR